MLKKIFLIMALILFITGCSSKHNYVDEENKIVTYCDEKYGIEYIREIGFYKGGISVRLDENGNVIHCEKVSDK